ncbi:hypothetical protein EAI_14393, partial [Harpegnathos saltator]
LTASLLDAAKQILGIAVSSGNLKGTYIKVLAAAKTAGATILGKRISLGTGEADEILEEIREENKKLRTSYEEVRKEIDEMK